MSKRKFYLREEYRNKQEKETGLVSYGTFAKRYFQDLVLCNKLPEIDSSIWDNIQTGNPFYYVDENGEYRTKEEYENDETGTIEEYQGDIYQFFLCNLSKWDLKEIQSFESESILISYSDLLDCDVLMVQHFGTSWDYVSTDIELTDKI